MAYCPNCNNPVDTDARTCPSCTAEFGVGSAWTPTETPGGPPRHSWKSEAVNAGTKVSDTVPTASATSGQKISWWSLRWIWPKIHDIESAKSATLHGVAAAAIISVVTAVVATISLVAQKPILGGDAWIYIDAILMAIVAWRIKHFSRAFAIGGIALFIIAKIVQIPNPGIFNMAFVLLLFLINGARGVFAYNRFKPTSLWGESSRASEPDHLSGIAPTASTTIIDSATDDKFFEQALTEIDSGQTIKATWARSLAGAEGDLAKAKALYIRFRVDNLKLHAAEGPIQLEVEAKAEARKPTTDEAHPGASGQQASGIATNQRVSTTRHGALGGILFALVAAILIIGVVTTKPPQVDSTGTREPAKSPAWQQQSILIGPAPATAPREASDYPIAPAGTPGVTPKAPLGSFDTYPIAQTPATATGLAARPGDVFPSAFATEGLAGKWTRQGDDSRSSGTLSISKVSTDGFEFLQIAFWHLNDKAGTIYFDNVEGVARYKGSDGIFQDEHGCEVRFRRREHLIIVSARGCLKHSDRNVTFDGEYVRESLIVR